VASRILFFDVSSSGRGTGNFVLLRMLIGEIYHAGWSGARARGLNLALIVTS